MASLNKIKSSYLAIMSYGRVLKKLLSEYIHKFEKTQDSPHFSSKIDLKCYTFLAYMNKTTFQTAKSKFS